MKSWVSSWFARQAVSSLLTVWHMLSEEMPTQEDVAHPSTCSFLKILSGKVFLSIFVFFFLHFLLYLSLSKTENNIFLWKQCNNFSIRKKKYFLLGLQYRQYQKPLFPFFFSQQDRDDLHHLRNVDTKNIKFLNCSLMQGEFPLLF